jgi:hypothetical protein
MRPLGSTHRFRQAAFLVALDQVHFGKRGPLAEARRVARPTNHLNLARLVHTARNSLRVRRPQDNAAGSLLQPVKLALQQRLVARVNLGRE